MSLADAQITIRFGDLDALKNDRTRLEAIVTQLEVKLREAMVADADGTNKLLLEVIEALFEIVAFAVGNLSPLAVRGWPYDALDTVGKALMRLPVKGHLAELGPTLCDFADRCRYWEDKRFHGVEKETLAEENLMRAPDPEKLLAAMMATGTIERPTIPPEER